MASGYKDSKGKFHPISRNKRSPSRKSHTTRDAKLTTSLGSILSPPKRNPSILIKQINDDLDFRDKLIDENKKLKDEIKADPKSVFNKGEVEEFNENSKEIKNLGKDAKRAFNDLPKESKQSLDRETINRLRVLR